MSAAIGLNAMECSQNIHDFDMKILDHALWLEEGRKRLTTEEMDVALQVATETENGKPKFSNETARKAEISARLASADWYQEFADILRDREKEMKLAQIERDSAYRLYQIALAFGGNK